MRARSASSSSSSSIYSATRKGSLSSRKRSNWTHSQDLKTFVSVERRSLSSSSSSSSSSSHHKSTYATTETNRSDSDARPRRGVMSASSLKVRALAPTSEEGSNENGQGSKFRERRYKWAQDVDEFERPDQMKTHVSLARGEVLTVSVPATTANIGPGFDCLGFAVGLRNELRVEIADRFEVVLKGEGVEFLAKDETNAVIVAAKKAFKYHSKENKELDCSNLRFTSTNRIPPARGLGSSSAALVCGLACGMTLAGCDVSTAKSKRDLLNLACEVEGHPDNVAPAIYGGFQIAVNDKKEWITSSVNIPEGMLCALFIPDFHSLTSETRAQLKTELTQAEAIFNIGRTATLINAFNNSDFRLMKYGTQDIMHQHQRGDKQFGLDKIIAAAIGAGAHCCFLSGAGPTVMALTGGDEKGNIGDSTIAAITAERVAEAMSDAAKAFGVEGQALIVEPTNEGIDAFIDVFDEEEADDE